MSGCLLLTDIWIDFETLEHELRRSLPDHFRQEVGPIISSLLQANFHLPLNVDPDLLDQICDTATALALQRLTSGSETAPSYPHSSMVPRLHLEEAYPANPPSMGQLGTNLVQPQGEMYGLVLHDQYRPPSQGYPVPFPPGGSVAPNAYLGNMSSTGQNISGGYQFPLPPNFDAGILGASLDMALAQSDGGVDPIIYPQSNSPLTYRSIPGPGYS